jgi:hypothetical protein
MNRKAKWKSIDIFDPTYVAPDPNYKNRVKPSLKETIAVNVSKKIGARPVVELANIVNAEFKNNNLKPMTDQYSVKYIVALFKRGILNRKMDSGIRQYLYY